MLIKGLDLYQWAKPYFGEEKTTRIRTALQTNRLE